MTIRIIRDPIDSPNLTLFVQGSWEAANNRRNLIAARALLDSHTSSVVLYESPRDWDRLENWPAEREMTNADWGMAFDGKTYLDELAGLKEIIDYINQNHSPQTLCLSGSSYGGSLAVLASAAGIPNLTKMLLAAPQIVSPHPRNPPNIYQEFPGERKFLEAVSQYQGRLRVLHSISVTKID